MKASFRYGFIACFVFGAVFAGCTPKRIHRPATPAFDIEPADFGDVILVIDRFEVAGESKHDGPSDVDMLEKSLASYLERATTFRAVLVDPPSSQQGPLMVVDVEVDLLLTRNRTWVFDIVNVYPFVGLFPFVPQWGNARVTVTLKAYDGERRKLWTTVQDGASSYWTLFYSWYRTRPEEEAFENATGVVFELAAKALNQSHGKVMAALGGTGPESDAMAGTSKSSTTGGGHAASVASSSPGSDSENRIPPPSLPAGTKLAVVPVDLDPSAKDEIPDLFNDYLLSAVQNAGDLEVIGRDDIDALLGFEAQKDLLSCDEASCMADLGGALGVDFIVAMKVARLGGDWVATSKLINIRDVRVEARTNEFVPGDVKKLLLSLPALIGRLLAVPPARS